MRPGVQEIRGKVFTAEAASGGRKAWCLGIFACTLVRAVIASWGKCLQVKLEGGLARSRCFILRAVGKD